MGVVDGIWVKYGGNNPSSEFLDSEVKRVTSDLEGHKTGWIVQSPYVHLVDTALSWGGVLIYYTKDDNGEFTVPRIYIQLHEWDIQSIFGRAKNGYLEPNMLSVLSQKLRTFKPSDNVKYYNDAIEDMKTVSNIYKKFKENVNLSLSDLKILYQIDRLMSMFGRKNNVDPRIDEIIATRDKIQDLANIFGCEREQIALKKYEMGPNQICYDIGVEGAERVFACTFDDVEMCNKAPSGASRVIFYHLTDATGLVLRDGIRKVTANNLRMPTNLYLPYGVEKCSFEGLESVSGLCLPDSVSRLDLKNVSSTVDNKPYLAGMVVHTKDGDFSTRLRVCYGRNSYYLNEVLDLIAEQNMRQRARRFGR